MKTMVQKLARFRFFFYQSLDFFLLVPAGSQTYRKILIFSYFHIGSCGQIWLNHLR